MSNGENPDWTQRWQQRKKLLTDVAEQIFDFDGRWSVFDVFGYPCTTECDAFCRLLYYVHLLGDHAAFTTYSYNRVIKGQQGKDQVMPLACLLYTSSSDRFDLGSCLVEGTNTIEIKLATTMINRVRVVDPLFESLEPGTYGITSVQIVPYSLVK